MNPASKNRWPRGVSFGLAMFCAFLAMAIMEDGGGRDEIVFSAGLSACAAIAVLLRLGWIIPSTILGILFGRLIPVVHSHFDIWQSVSPTICGALAGLVFGVLLDAFRNEPR